MSRLIFFIYIIAQIYDKYYWHLSYSLDKREHLVFDTIIHNNTLFNIKQN